MPEEAPKTIREAVADSLSNLSERTRAQVIEHFASKEADKQADALVKGLNKLDELTRERYKIKPAYVGYDAEGKGVGEPFFTKEQLESLKKNGEQTDKLTKAIEKADDKNDFGDLYNLTK